ncbi:MAG TPA: hypothetical protein PLP26_06745 [Ilumatobacteraceae bacterium]|nr:hypothetical protein [Ilumatobacteraceae bacterium]
MTATLSDVREGLAEAVSELGCNVYPVPFDSIDTPAIVIAGARVARDGMGGVYSYVVTVNVLVSRDDPANIAQLDTFVDPLSTSSVVAAIEGGDTLGARVDDVACIDHGTETMIEIGGVFHYGAQFAFEVYP